MRSKFLQTAKETFYSSLPLAVIIVLRLLIAPLGSDDDYFKIIIGYVCVVFGQSMFLVGLETSILPIGRMVGGSFAKYNKLAFVLTFGFVFGLLATVAEPALAVLAKPKTIFGITIDTEKEIVVTVVEKDVAVKIVQAVKEKAGAGTAAHGLCFFMPVEMSTLTASSLEPND